MGVTKRVVVTGANKGVGFATVAEILEREADSFVFLGSRSVERGEKARQALVDERPQWADRVEVLPIDVSDDASVQAAAQTVADRFESEEKPLYGIVNNAGIGDREHGMAKVLNVNTRGPRRVAKAFESLIARDVDGNKGRIVNIASASGPNFIAKCSEARQQVLTDPDVTWEQIEAFMEEAVTLEEERRNFEAAGLGDGSAYGLSKACLNAYTMVLARECPELLVNACTPGFIETDMTRPMAKRQGVSPQEMGMKPPREGTKAPLFLLFGTPEGSGWYFGSDAKRSPMDRYRSPGDPAYRGE